MDTREELLEAVRKHGDFDSADLRQIHLRGVDADWPGFTDFVDTWAFYHRNHELIWGLLREHAEEQGKTPIEIIGMFERADEIDDGHKFKKAMSLFVLSEATRYFVEQETRARQD